MKMSVAVFVSMAVSSSKRSSSARKMASSNPRIVEDELLERPAARARGHLVRVGKDAVGRPVLLHRREVEIAEGAPLRDGRLGLRRRLCLVRLGALVAEQSAKGEKKANL
eukprot:scaffold21824_cov28-Tisochrysis_lutea.AAC.3